MVNTGQLRSVNWGQFKSGYVHPSIGPSVRATYGTDEETDKKGPLIDPPYGGY